MEARRSQRILTDALLRYAGQTVWTDEKQREAYYKYIFSLRNQRNKKAMLEDAKDRFYFSDEELDRDIYILNVQNGVLDLSGSEPVFMKHNPDLLLSKVCNASYNPDADCSLWKKTINEVFQENQELIRYFQKLLGRGLTGEVDEEECYIFYGASTRNGKSTLLETYSYMLGNYAVAMKVESLAQGSHSDGRTQSGDIARLKGSRFCVASEPDKGMIFDAGLLKSMIGRDTIVCRRMHESEFEYQAQFKLVFNCNHLPKVTDTTLFKSDRIRVLPFSRHFTEEERDKRLKDKLKRKSEISGLLNWCIEGLKLYRIEGMKPPKEVISSTDDYEQRSDKLGCFISEMLEESGKNSKAGEIYEIFSKWCNDGGFGTESKSTFFSEMKARGIFANSGTVDGRTCRNVIKGYIPAFIEAESTPFD